MPNDLLGPTLEEVQMWLRSPPGWVPAGFVLNVEPVNARLGRVLVVEDDPGIATQLVRGLTPGRLRNRQRHDRQGGARLAGPRRFPARSRPAPHGRRGGLAASPPGLRRGHHHRDGEGEETDRVLALDEGADAYLIKPFGLE